MVHALSPIPFNVWSSNSVDEQRTNQVCKIWGYRGGEDFQVEVYWVMTPCGVAAGYQQRFGGQSCLHLHVVGRLSGNYHEGSCSDAASLCKDLNCSVRHILTTEKHRNKIVIFNISAGWHHYFFIDRQYSIWWTVIAKPTTLSHGEIYFVIGCRLSLK